MQKFFRAIFHRCGLKGFINDFTNSVLLFISGKRKNGGDFQRIILACLLFLECLIITFRCLNAAYRKHGIKAFAARIQAVRFFAEMLQDIFGDFADAFGMQECLAVFGGSQFLFILLAFQRLKLRACVVVIHFEFQHFFIADGVSNHIGMQFTAKDTRCRFRSQGVIGKNGRTGKAKLAELLEFLFQIFLRLAEL